MIVSNKFLRSNYGKPLRDFLIKHAAIEKIVDFAGLPVFPGATVRTIILLTSQTNNGEGTAIYSPPVPIDKFPLVAAGTLSIDNAIEDFTYTVAFPAESGSAWKFCQCSRGCITHKATIFLPAVGRVLSWTYLHGNKIWSHRSFCY